MKDGNGPEEGVRPADTVVLCKGEQVPRKATDVLGCLQGPTSHVPIGEGIPGNNLNGEPRALLGLPPAA